MAINKRILEESPMQAIPTPKSILNYEDDEVVAAIKKEVAKNKDYTVLRITHQANQYYNVVISYIVPDEDWSFELDKYRYIMQLHTYRVQLFTALSKVLPVVNVNLMAFDFVKGNNEIKFCLTILLSDTNNKDWVTGRRKQTIDQRERMKLLQTEAKKPKKIDPKKQQAEAQESALQKLIDIIEKKYKEIKNEGEFLKFYTIITGRRKPRGYNAEGWFKDYEGQAREEIKTSIEWIHDIEEAKTIIQKMVKYGIMNPVIKETENLKEYYYNPSKIREREFHFPFDDFYHELFDALYEGLPKVGNNDFGMEDLEELMKFYHKLIKNEWYEGNSVETAAKRIIGKLTKKKVPSYEPTEDEGSIVESDELNEDNQTSFAQYKSDFFNALITSLDEKEMDDIEIPQITKIMLFQIANIKKGWENNTPPSEITDRIVDVIKNAKEKKKLKNNQSFNEDVELNEIYIDPYESKNRESNYPFEDYKIAVSDALDNLNVGTSETIESLIEYFFIKLKTAWYENKPPEKVAQLIAKNYSDSLVVKNQQKREDDSIEEDVALDYEFAPSNVQGTPTTDEDFLECDNSMKAFPVKESELMEGKLYSLFESNGLIVDTVQYIKQQDGKYLFEKSATGRKIKLSKNDVISCIKKMKKKVIKEGWKMRDEISVPDAFKAAELARKIPGVISANAITQDKLSITYDGRKLDGETLKIKLN